FFFSSRRRHTRFSRDWSSDVCSSDLIGDFVGSRTLPQFLDEVSGWLQALFPGLPPEFLDEALANLQDWLLDNWGSITGGVINVRSEERRVGKEWRLRGQAGR